jgi:hypothetical protein
MTGWKNEQFANSIRSVFTSVSILQIGIELCPDCLLIVANPIEIVGLYSGPVVNNELLIKLSSSVKMGINHHIPPAKLTQCHFSLMVWIV